MGSNDLNMPVSGSMQPMTPGVAFAALGVLGQFQLCFGREGIVTHRCCSPRYEMIVEDHLLGAEPGAHDPYGARYGAYTLRLSTA